MHRMRTLFVVFAVVALCGAWAEGQDKAKDQKAKGQLPSNWGKLGLSEEQKQKVYRIRNDYSPKIDDLRKQITELQDKERRDMEGVLSDAHTGAGISGRDPLGGYGREPPSIPCGRIRNCHDPIAKRCGFLVKPGEKLARHFDLGPRKEKRAKVVEDSDLAPRASFRWTEAGEQRGAALHSRSITRGAGEIEQVRDPAAHVRIC